jgi:cation diffusion facilitator family transporter
MEAIALDDHEQGTPERQQAARRSTWTSVGVNIALTVAQVAAGLVSGSQGLVADGLHSLSDLVADFVVLIANRHSHQAPDDDHHYGHHRYENAASLVLSVLLLAVGGGMLWSAVAKISTPHLVSAVQPLALWIALGALVAKELLFRYMLSVAERVRSAMLVANAWHARSDAASSLVVALGIGGNLLGLPILDPVAALVVGLIVVKMGGEFGWNALHDLMDRAADEADVAKIRAVLLATDGVRGLHDLRTRKAGDLILVDVHLEVDADMTVAQGHTIAVEARRRVMAAAPVLNLMTHVDPVLIKNV